MSLRPGLVALLETSGVTLHVGGAPRAEGPAYAVLYAAAGTLSFEAPAAVPDGLHVGFQVTSVSLRGPEEAESVARRCRDSLVAKVPQVSGWVCGPVQQIDSRAVTRDEDRPDETVWYCTDQYEVLAARA